MVNSRLLVTDSDSLTYAIKTKDVYEGFSKDKEMFDFNNMQLNQNIMIIQTEYLLVR